MKKRISRLLIIALALVMLTAVPASAYSYSIRHGEFSNSYCSSFLYEGMNIWFEVALNDVVLEPGSYTVTSTTPGVVSFNEDYTMISADGTGETELIVHYGNIALKKNLSVFEVPELTYEISKNNTITVDISQFDNQLTLYFKGALPGDNDDMWHVGYTSAMGSYSIPDCIPGETYSFVMRYWDNRMEDWVVIGDQLDVTIPVPETEPTEPSETEPPATQPPATEPIETEPPATEPAPTEPAPTVPEPEKPSVSFTDVKNDAYYYAPVMWAVDNGITNGMGDNAFCPDTVCTRAQVVTFLWRAAGKPQPGNTVNPFIDVAKNAYYYDAVLWAVEQGITTGTSSQTFSPDDSCTRAQVVTFLWRAAGKPGLVNNSNPFRDVKQEYYFSAVLWAVQNGITNGMGENTFQPHTTCNRSQIVTFLYRYQNG